MSHPFDATLKDVLAQDPKDFESVPAFALPKIAPARTLNVDLSTISAATDVAFGFGEPMQEIVDLNFQSGPDPWLPDRLLLYNAAYRLREHVPVRSVAILLRPKAESPGLSGKLSYAAGGKQVEFAYDVVRMWEQPVEPFLQGGLGLLPLATLCNVAEDLQAGLRPVIREIDRRLGLETDHGRAVRLMTAAFILTGMRVPKETLAEIYEGVRIMHESTAFDMMMEEGLAKGMEKGLAKGMEKGLATGMEKGLATGMEKGLATGMEKGLATGMATGLVQGHANGLVEGRVEESHRLLTRLGTLQFGAPDGKARTLLASIRDLDRLERIAEAVLTAKSWHELLSTQ